MTIKNRTCKTSQTSFFKKTFLFCNVLNTVLSVKKWQGGEGGGVENESVVGLSSLVGFLGKFQKAL